MSKLTFEYEPLDGNGDGDEWSCHVRCGRCAHIKADGQRCRNRTCFGFPMCWVHNKTVHGVRVMQSTIPNSGKGLFATRPIASGAWICPYGGEEVDDACIDLRYAGNATAPYADQLNNGTNLDAACERGIGSMAQGKFGANGKSLAKNRHNAEGVSRRIGGRRTIWLRATRAIATGAEIFHYYGDEYRLEATHTTRRFRSQDSRPC